MISDTQSTQDLHFSFSNWLQQSGLDLWILFSNFSSNEQDFVELLAYVKRKINRKKIEDQSSADRCFYRQWSRRFRLDRREDVEFINLFLLFRLKWSPERVSYFTNSHLSKVYFIATQALKERVKEAGPYTRAKNLSCSKTDLRLTELLLHGSKAVAQTPKALNEVHQHIASCSRCMDLLQDSEKIAQALAHEKEEKELPGFILQLLPISSERRFAPAVYRRWSSKYFRLQPFLWTLLAVLIVAGVVSIPYVGEIRFSRTAPELSSKPREASNEILVVEGDRDLIDVEALTEKVLFPWELFPAKLPESNMIAAELALFENAVAQKPKALPVVKESLPVKVVAEEKSQPSSAQDLFYRWGAYSANPEADAQSVVQWLQELKGIQSGELELGADYRGGKYFHFEVPTDIFPELVKKIESLNMNNFTRVQANSSRSATRGYTRVVFLIRSVNKL